MFKDKLKKLRKERNLTQAELAKALKVSTATIGNYESGIRKPRNKEMWIKIAKYFDVSVDELMSLNNVTYNMKTLNKSKSITGHYINVYHPYNHKYYDIYFVISDPNRQQDEAFNNRFLNIVQPIIEDACNKRKTKEELYDALREKFDELSSEKPIENFEFDYFFGYQIIIHNWLVLK